MKRLREARYLLAVVAAAGALAVLGSCGFDTLVTGDGSGGEDSCAWMRASQNVSKNGTLVLFDQSNSTRAGSAADQVVDEDAVLKDVLANAVDNGDSVRLGTFDGTSASVQVRQTLTTDSGAQNPDNQKEDRDSAKQCLADAVRGVAEGPPGQPGSDVLGAVEAAKGAFAQQSGKKNIVLVTDGLATVGCADLRNLAIGKDSEVDRVTAGCAAREPDLRGYTLTLLGVGHPAAGQPLPGSGSLAWLNSLWSTLCGRMRADSCRVSTAPVTTRAAGTRVVAPGAADPTVTFPPEDGLARGSEVLHVSADVLFTNNSWAISDTGRAMLKAGLGGHLNAKIEVDGYTEAQSTAAYNQHLAQQRADAVRQALIALGAKDVTAVGFATTAPHCPGGADDQARQCNRRVDIKVADG
ncbi:MAG TPA: OmpA family protein [Amycolatopsis sp.]|uniref:OmpA family protein n=1 Tax=Amycolatopsis nalaikhensis TaxID=715472 RepID=A0ABY8Y021_9PSEU|nr:OmpA family protein [Amycolatopsis sp. 2-2]WIV61031.1 OmpA family protein [Amycolatopsis sp. 2-2]